MKKRFAAAACALACLFMLLSGCADTDGGVKNGYYNAEMSDYSHGWKEFVTIRVQNDTIVSVEYGAKDASGYIKAWDMAYMRTMNRVSGTYPNKYTREYVSQALSKQGGQVDALTGATHSYHSFAALMDAVMERAKAGDSSVAIVKSEGE